MNAGARARRIIDADAYPLYWPGGWERTQQHKRKRSRYQVKMAKARDDLLKELRLLGARDAVISTNVALRRDGLPYANTPEPEDPGVAVYWVTKDKEQQVIACDCWTTVAENVRAIGLTIKALREIERTGASQILERAFLGFKALPPGSAPMDYSAALVAFGLTPGAHTREEIEQKYRQLARVHHPDHGGSDEAMARLNQAKTVLLEDVS